MLSERSQTQKDTQGVIPLMGIVQNRQIDPQRQRVDSWLSGAEGGRWQSPNREGVSFWDDRMFWN